MPSPLKICLLGYRSNPYSGGQGIYLKYLSSALCDLGHELDVISGPPYPVVDPRVNLIKLPSLDLSAKKSRLKAFELKFLFSYTDFYEWLDTCFGGFPEPYVFGRRLVDHIKKNHKHYDIIHDNQSLCTGLLHLQKKGYAVVSTIHHPITRDKKIAIEGTDSLTLKLLIRRWYGFLGMQKKVAKRLKHIHCVSASSKHDASSDFGFDQNKVSVIHNGIDTEAFSPIAECKKDAFQIIATASADAPLKGLDYLLKALALLKEKFPKIKLNVIGSPRPGGHTERLIKRLELTEIVQFIHGVSVETIQKKYAKASIAVVPSLYEGFGFPAGEAMACEVAVVSTTGGALPEVVGDAGILIPSKDENALATAIAELLNNPVKRAELSKLGRKRILEEFSWQKCAIKMTAYYHKILEQQKKSK